MIAYLNGKITFKSPTHITMEMGGIGFLVKISLHTFEKVRGLDSCVLHTSLIVKNEGQSLSGYDLFGFFEESEKDLFEKLISVSGIGANTARMMLSSFRADEIKNAILTENEALIQSIKGVGPKTAKRVILELKDKVGKASAEQLLVPAANNMVKDEALSALLALGFNKQAADKVLTKIMGSGRDTTVESLIKEALKHL